MSKKKMLSLILALLLLISCVGCSNNVPNDNGGSSPTGGNGSAPSGSEDSGQKLEKIKIGVSVPLTGGSAEQGTRTLKGVTLAVEECNEQGGINGVMIEIDAQDDTAAPQQAATIANRFVADSDVLAVIGYTQSSCALAAAPIMNDGKLTQIATFSSNVDISNSGPYTFRVCNTDATNVLFCLDILLGKKCENIAVLYENNDFGVGCYKNAVSYLGTKDMEPAAAEQIILGETKDFSTIITKFKAAGVTGVYCAMDETELAMFMKQSHQLDFYPLVSSPGTYNPNVITLGGEDTEGMYGFTFFDPMNMPEAVSDYFNRLFERFPELEGTDLHSTTGYTAATAVIEALKSGVATREEVNEYLTDLKDFDTMYGKLSFDENGDMSIPLQVVVIKDGQFALDN